MDKWRGTTVPNTGLVEKVYLNINLNDEEITEICSKLTMKLEGWAEYILNTAESSDISLYIVDLEAAYNQKGYAIINAITEEKYYVSTQNEISDEYTFVGWNPDFNGEIVVNKELTPEHNGVASGSQNELLVELFSSEPIVELKLNLDDFLTDLAESIRYVKGTEEKINAQHYSSEIRKFKGASGSSTPVDNGAIYEGKYRVRYFDTDGTILKIEYVEEGGKLTPPDNPSYDPEYLIFAEWNYDTDNYIVEQPTDIGAIYDTVDDVTYLFCRFTAYTGWNPTLKITGFTSIDWGDGTVNTDTSHTYSKEGMYIIKISGSFTLIKNEWYIMGSDTLNKCLQKVYVSNSLSTLPSFYNSWGLKTISIPKSITTMGSCFNTCRGLQTIIIPNGITSFPSSSINYCYALKNFILPLSIVEIKGNWAEVYGIREFIIPKNVHTIGPSILVQSFVNDYFLCCDEIPTLASSSAIGVTPYTIIWVKDKIINSLKVATNWSDYINYIKPLSWYPSLTDPNA